MQRHSRDIKEEISGTNPNHILERFLLKMLRRVAPDAVTTRLAVHMDTNEQPQSEGGCTVWIFVCMRVCVFVLSLGERWRGKEYNSCLCVSKRE